MPSSEKIGQRSRFVKRVSSYRKMIVRTMRMSYLVNVFLRYLMIDSIENIPVKYTINAPVNSRRAEVNH